MSRPGSGDQHLVVRVYQPQGFGITAHVGMVALQQLPVGGLDRSQRWAPGEFQDTQDLDPLAIGAVSLRRPAQSWQPFCWSPDQPWPSAQPWRCDSCCRQVYCSRWAYSWRWLPCAERA